MSVDIRVLTPDGGLQDHLPDLARLRITVFRDWPYLYEGSETEEQEYLSVFATSPGAVCIATFDNGQMVGASTGMPLVDEHDAFKKPFLDAGHDVKKIFYCAESVLLPAYRCRGIYRHFFDGREQHARSLGGYKQIVFCGVMRAEHHPKKPKDAKALDPVWRHFGYTPCPGIMATFNWRDVGDDTETPKLLQFWGKGL